MKTIAINISGVVRNSGIDRYGTELISGLRRIDFGNKYIIFDFNRTEHHNRNIVNKISKTIFDQIIIPTKIKFNKISLLHSVKDIGLPSIKIKSCKYVLTLYDIIPLLFPNYYLDNIIKKKLYEARLKSCIDMADRVISISETTKRDVIKYFNITDNKFEVIPLGVSDIFSKLNIVEIDKILKKNSIVRPYILGIGGSEPRKNNITLIKAYSILKRVFKIKHKLVIVGKDRSEKEFKQFIKSVENEYETVKSDIIFCREVEDEDLVGIYKGADIFVFLSIYEGFGLPPLEAMSCGVPVITSDISSLSEILSDCVLKTNPYNIDNIVKLIILLLNNKALKNELIMKGYNLVKQFTWHKTVEHTLRVYIGLLDQ